jgi:serine/threonine protein kinase
MANIINNELRSEVDHIGSYHLLPRSHQTDIVDTIYQIHTNRPISELGNQFCRYYFATNTTNEKEYFAIIFENGFNVPIKELAILHNSHCPHINNIVTYSLVRLGISRKYFVCAIVEPYNPIENLENLVESNGPMDEDIVENKLIPSINSALAFCEAHRINSCNISPRNIIVEKDGTIKLREFFIGLPAFDQPIAYIAPEIADAMPIARNSFSLAPDIYAFGMSVYYALTGSIPDFSKHEPKLFNTARIEFGSFNMTAGKKRMAQKFKIFLAWTLNDVSEERWKANDCIDWETSKSKGKMPKAKSTNTYTTLFNGHNYSNPLALASALHIYYDEGIKFCRNESFLKWVQKTKGKTEFIEDFLHMYLQDISSRNITTDDLEAAFFKIITMLDNSNQYIRLKNICISSASIPNIVFTAIYEDNQQLIDFIIKIFTKNYYTAITENAAFKLLPQEYLNKLLEAANILKANDNLEQIIYTFDQYTPCLSPVVSNDYVLSLEDLLVSLDRVAAHTPGKLSIDIHIVAFIRSRIGNVLDESNTTKNIEVLESSPLLKSMSLLAKAQENVSDIKIPHLCSVVAQKLIEWVNDNLYNAKLKNVITSELAELAGGGMLSQMLYVVSNSKLFQNDNKGYNVAHKQVSELNKKIKKMSDPLQAYNSGMELGQRLTVVFSYLICMIVTLILII